MAGRRPGGLEDEAAFLPPHQATIPPAAAMEDDDEEARFWSAMHDEEEQQQPSSASGPSLPRLSLPRFTQFRGADEEAPSPGSSLIPPAVGPSTSGHSSNASTATSSTSGSGGNVGQRRRSQQGASIGVGGLAGLKQGVGELLRAIAGSAGGIVYHAEASEGGGRRGRSHSRSSPSAMMGGPSSSSSYLELNRHAGDGFHYQRMEGEEDREGSPLRPEDEEDEEDGEARRGWAPVANLDVFFQTMYRYYQSKGFNSILAATTTNLLSMAFTVALSAWLLAFVDWGKLTTCHDEESCLSFGHYIHARAMSRYGLVWMYCLLFVLYWVASCYWALITLKDAAEMRAVYNDRLGISEEELTTIEWHEVVARFLEKQRSGEYRVSISQQELTAHDVASRILRRENFLVALIDQNVLDLRPIIPILGWKGKEPFLTRNLEWSLHVCLLHDMFDYRSFTLRRDFLQDEQGLRRRFVVAGLVQLALTPFLLVFMGMQFFLQNAQEWQQKKNYLGPRQWAPLAQWRFREYNEAPHLLERRLHAAYPHAMAYTRQCPRPVVAVLARCAAYVSGALVAVLLLFTLLDESILLYVRLWDRNLLWYVGVFSAAFAMSRSLIPGPEEQQYGTQEATMARVAAYTHYFPRRWRGRCSSREVRAEFLGELFQYKTALFQQEILSVLVTPLILIYSLPECAPAILSFLRQHAATVDGLGSVCAFSLFDLDKYGSPLYGGGGGGSSGDGDKPPKRVWEGASEGKVEKSLLNFCVNYPEWARAQAQAAAAAAAAAAGLQHATGSPASTTGSASGAGSGAALVLLGRLQAFQEAELARRREEQERALAEALKGAGNGDVAKSLLMLGAWQQQQQAGMAGGAFGGGPNLGMSYRGPGGMGGSYMQSSGYWGPQPPQQPLQYSALMLPPPPAANATGASAPFGGEGGGGGMYLPPHMVQGAGMGMGGGGAEMESSFYWLQRYAERFEQLEREREEREAGGGGGGGQERWRAGQEEADQKVAGGAKSASSPALGPAPATGTAGVPPSAAVPSTVL